MCLFYHNLKKKMNWGNVNLFLALTLSYVQKLHILWQIFPLEVKFTFSSCSVAIPFTISWDLNLCNLTFFLKNQKAYQDAEIHWRSFMDAGTWLTFLSAALSPYHCTVLLFPPDYICQRAVYFAFVSKNQLKDLSLFFLFR